MDLANDAAFVMGGVEDLSVIYKDMQQQFPECEMYKYKSYVQLLHNGEYKILKYQRSEDNELIGYALVYIVESSNILWLDYLAIRKKYQALGYGSAMFKALVQKYCGPFDGILFSVEHISKTDAKLAESQKKRVRFYERLGAKKLSADFLQPCEDGGFPMYLFFKPRRGCNVISRESQIQTIGQMYDYCFPNSKHSRELLPKFKDTIVNERLCK